MSNVVIVAERLSKRYQIGAQERYESLRDRIAESTKLPMRAFRRSRAVRDEERTLWALKDVSFEIHHGDAVGILGRNGAGKSTLLKILSRITSPTAGRVMLKGRVGALLEVGTGFHPELTGRDNIYLNGAILGMSKADIHRRFDEIVAFAEVERFLDTPVKHYSSGMHARLAFSVAAHLEPDILVVDEVLAVGDAGFQKKCLTKMEKTASGGRTVLFVSHNLATISALCSKAIALDRGTIVACGSVEEAVQTYLTQGIASKSTEWRGDEGDNMLRLKRMWVRSLDPSGDLHTAADIEVGLAAEILRPIDGLIFGFTLKSQLEVNLAYILQDDSETSSPPTVHPGQFTRRFFIPANTLAEGTYRIVPDIGIHMTRRIVQPDHFLTFDLENYMGRGRRFSFGRVRGFNGLFRPNWPVLAGED